MTGVLVLVGTPIGNLGDLAPRAVEALGSADVICCEDTRRTGRLLKHAGIEHRTLLMVNDHNESTRREQVVQRLDAGERVVVVTDAGMPGISDPGERLVRAAVAAGHRIEVVPGPSAGVTALVGSGLASGRYVFEGFLPRKGATRTQRLAELAREERTIVLYEAPHRLARLVADLAVAFGEHRRVVVARELTKLYEEFWRGTLGEAVVWAEETPPRGEIAVVIDGAPPRVGATDAELREALTDALAAGASKRDAATELAREFSVPKRRVYDMALALQKDL